MDVDFDESSGLPSCPRGALDADPLQLYEADYVGLGGLQPPEQIMHRNDACRSLATILDRHDVVKR